MGAVKWKRSTEDYVESHCGTWWITPNYWGCTRPQSYSLMRKIDGKWKTVSYHCATQRDAKADVERVLAKEDR
jgi:hypothetical protein